MRSRPFSMPSFSCNTRQHRTVKFFRLRHAHPVNFESDDVKTGARKNFDHAAGAQIRKLEIVRLDQDQCLLNVRACRDSRSRFPEFRRRDLKIPPTVLSRCSTCFAVNGCQHCRFEINYLAAISSAM